MATPKWNYYPLTTVPRALDIVWCHFPFNAPPFKPGPYPRPALVKSVAIGPGNVPEVEIVYGTSNLKMMKRRYDLFVVNSREMAEAGCPQATRFDLDNVIWLPWAKEFFKCRRGKKTPVVGHLSARGRLVLEYLIEARKSL